MKRSHLAAINLRSYVADTGMHGGGKEERAGGFAECCHQNFIDPDPCRFLFLAASQARLGLTVEEVSHLPSLVIKHELY